jgi:hypothetical protein
MKDEKPYKYVRTDSAVILRPGSEVFFFFLRQVLVLKAKNYSPNSSKRAFIIFSANWL